MILALDIATVTGWAAGSPRDNQPSAGTIKLEGSIGQKVSQLRRALVQLIDKYSPELIIFEQPIHTVTRKGSSKVMRLVMALCGVVEMAAYEARVRVLEVAISTWRKHFIGYGRAPQGMPKTWCKDQAIQRCKLLGWGDLPHDSAEACGIWDYACSLRSKAHQVQTAPGLFQR